MLGNSTRVKVVKNKVAPPFKEARFDILFGEGISKAGDVLDLAVDCSIVEKSGSWYAYQGERLGQGRDFVRNHLKENPDLLAEIESKVREYYQIPAAPAVAGDGSAESS
jgi:recombination protein RecA